SIYRKYLKLRYKFISYLYDLFYQESKTGLPIMRPLILNYPADQKVSNMNDQFMVGDQVLVSPVLQAGATAKMVYLPQG
ncbi:glycoside hydrolase family 31 protein, partial [Klebsiella pneumoniae]